MPFDRRTLGLLAVFSVLTAFAISANAVPPLVTTIAEEFGQNYEDFGHIFSLQYFFFAVAAWTGGWAAARLGLTNRGLVMTGLFVMGLLLLAGSQLQSLAWFAIWALPLGYAGGLTETFGSVMIANLGGVGSSKMMNLAQVFYCLGAVIAPQLAAVFLDLDLSWRLALASLSLMILLIAALFTHLTRDLIRRPAGEPAASADEPSEPPVRLLTDRTFHLLAIALFLYVSIECVFVCWIASYFEKFLDVPKEAAASRLRDFWIGMIAGRLLTLALPRRWTLWPAAIVASAGLAAGCALLSFRWPPLIATLLVVVTSLAAGPFWPALVVLSQQVRRSSRFTSAVIGAGALGAAAGPFASGLVIKHFGQSALFPATTAAGLVFLIAVLLAHRQAVRP
ncbi:MAG: MFS transporter [Phycisphaerae bacterium]|nr:MFS transporter [Phycisphaerae bacterium]